MDLLSLSQEIQNDLFSYNIAGLPARIATFFDAVVNNDSFTRLQTGEIQHFNVILQSCLQSLQYQDYLRLADLLEYEVGPILKLLDKDDSDGPVQ